MKKLSRTAASFALCFVALTAWAAPGEGCTKTAPNETAQYFSQLLDNPSMRLWEIELKPGEFADVHGHPGQKAYAATDGVLQVTTTEGKIEEIKVRAGDELWTDVTKYKTVNAGANAFKAVVYETKAEQVQRPQNFYSFFSAK